MENLFPISSSYSRELSDCLEFYPRLRKGNADDYEIFRKMLQEMTTEDINKLADIILQYGGISSEEIKGLFSDLFKLINISLNINNRPYEQDKK